MLTTGASVQVVPGANAKMELGVWKLIGWQGDSVRDRGEVELGREPWIIVHI